MIAYVHAMCFSRAVAERDDFTLVSVRNDCVLAGCQTDLGLRPISAGMEGVYPRIQGQVKKGHAGSSIQVMCAQDPVKRIWLHAVRAEVTDD